MYLKFCLGVLTVSIRLSLTKDTKCISESGTPEYLENVAVCAEGADVLIVVGSLGFKEEVLVVVAVKLLNEMVLALVFTNLDCRQI